MDRQITVSEDFARYAFEAANKLVYNHRMERYKNSTSLVINAIELRNECIDDFIDNYLESFGDGISWDAYEIIDEWYGSDEKSYDEIRAEIRVENYQDEEDEDYSKTYKGTSEQLKCITEWCNDNGYWCDDSYEVAVQDVFTYGC